MKYLRLSPYYIQLENVAFLEFASSEPQDAKAGGSGEFARIYFSGRPEPLEIRDPESIQALKRHFV